MIKQEMLLTNSNCFGNSFDISSEKIHIFYWAADDGAD